MDEKKNAKVCATLLMGLAHKGGLRKKPRGEKTKLELSRVQIGLVERVVGTDDSTRKLVIAAMEMGTGKTLAALATMCVLRGKKEHDRPIRALFVVPKSTLYNAWRHQLRLFTRLQVDDVRVVTYPRLQNAFMRSCVRNNNGVWKKKHPNALLDMKRDLVVFDESHLLRNPKTILGRAASMVSKKSDRVLCLTGTPVHNGPEDASGQLCAMSSCSAFEDPTELGNRIALRRDAVRAFSTRFIYSATLADAGVQLKKKIIKIKWIDHSFSEDILKQYNTSLSCVQGTGSAAKNIKDRVKHHMLILRQLCVEPALFHKFGRPVFDKHALKLTTQSPGPKLREALLCVRRLVFEGHQKIVIVSEFVCLLDAFRELASEHLGEECLAFDGRLGAAARGKVIDEFLNSDNRILCLSLGAGAYGLNLTPGPTAMIVMDVWFNPAVHRQVEARIHRFGQKEPVEVHILVMRDSVEAAILETHEKKEECATNLISGTMENNVNTSAAKRIAEKCKELK